MRIVDNWQEASNEISTLLCSDRPVFLNRIGGGDTNATATYLCLKEGNALSGENARLLWHMKRTAEFNGFYDSKNDREIFYRYCEELLRCYRSSEYLFMGGSPLLSMYFPTTVSKEFFLTEIENRSELLNLIAHITRESQKTFYFYQLVENMILNPWTLFSVFAKALINKKVLVVSPFAETISKNFCNRQSFFKNYDYPEFELLTVNAPITYSGLPAALYPHADWFETLHSLQEDISAIDFDIALLSCGSYATPLGNYAEQILQKKAVYVGGVLQLYFGVMGRRYEGPFVAQQINAEKFVYPVERDKYLKYAKLGPDAVKEAFGAYL